MAPAMRIAVLLAVRVNQNALFSQVFDHAIATLLHVHATDHREVLGEGSVVLHRAQILDAVALADHKVFQTIGRRRVNTARTGFERDVIPIEHGHRVTPGRLHLDTHQIRTRAAAQNFMFFNFPTGQDGFKEAFGQYQCARAVFFNANQHIIQRITHADKTV